MGAQERLPRLVREGEAEPGEETASRGTSEHPHHPAGADGDTELTSYTPRGPSQTNICSLWSLQTEELQLLPACSRAAGCRQRAPAHRSAVIPAAQPRQQTEEEKKVALGTRNLSKSPCETARGRGVWVPWCVSKHGHAYASPGLGDATSVQRLPSQFAGKSQLG